MKSNIKRLFSYTLRYKLSFTVSIIGFLMFAAANIKKPIIETVKDNLYLRV